MRRSFLSLSEECCLFGNAVLQLPVIDSYTLHSDGNKAESRLCSDLHLMAMQAHRVNQIKDLFLFNARTRPSSSSCRTFHMGPPATPSAGMPQHGKSNGGYTVYGGVHQGRQAIQPQPLPQINPYYHSHGQNSPVYAVSAQSGRSVVVRRYRPGH
ncbi:hypothetical protein BGY98DRAFT_932950 [Russula aff. rugulosa BPL654]|nr:hypothetical protein BGY98DRAFT_932950 [Russula aff. rugulosa BPL654]